MIFQAALIFALDPVWGAVFAKVILDEGLGPQGLVGGVLIISAAAASQLLRPQKTNYDEAAGAEEAGSLEKEA